MSEGARDLNASELLWLWEQLVKNVREGGGEVFQPADPDVGGDFLLSLGEGGAPEVLVTINADQNAPDGLSGKNIRINKSVINYAGRKRKTIRLTCAEPALQQVFAELVADIYRRMRRGRSGQGSVRDAVTEFRRLLESGATGEVSREQAAGLAAELLVLKDLLQRRSDAWQTWEGPLGGEHDFHHADRSLEVKASVRREPVSVEIHGIRQLDPPAGGLHLVHQILVPDSGGAVSVPSIVDELNGLVSDPSGFFGRLLEVGYSSFSKAAWERHRFSLGQQRYFRVGDEFPRITPDRLTAGQTDPGVDSVQFSLRLDALTEWEVPAVARGKLLDEFVHDD